MIQWSGVISTHTCFLNCPPLRWRDVSEPRIVYYDNTRSKPGRQSHGCCAIWFCIEWKFGAAPALNQDMDVSARYSSGGSSPPPPQPDPPPPLAAPPVPLSQPRSLWFETVRSCEAPTNITRYQQHHHSSSSSSSSRVNRITFENTVLHHFIPSF